MSKRRNQPIRARPKNGQKNSAPGKIDHQTITDYQQSNCPDGSAAAFFDRRLMDQSHQQNESERKKIGCLIAIGEWTKQPLGLPKWQRTLGVISNQPNHREQHHAEGKIHGKRSAQLPCPRLPGQPVNPGEATQPDQIGVEGKPRLRGNRAREDDLQLIRHHFPPRRSTRPRGR